MSENPKKKNDKATNGERRPNPVTRTFSALWRWIRRMFMGASKELTEDEIFAVEKLESPSKMALKNFFRRKLATAAFCILAALFLFVFIAPYFIPMDPNYTDTLQANLPPNLSMRSVPSGLKKNIRSISGFSNFSLGVSKDSKLFVWGITEDPMTGIDMSDFPEEITDSNVYTAAAGSDFIIAITTDGKIVGWGDSSHGQYGPLPENPLGIVGMPEELMEKGISDLSKIGQLTCGYQVTALVYDGQLYMWGNKNACYNLKDIAKGDNGVTGYTGVKKVMLANYYAILLMEDGSIVAPGGILNFQSATSSGGEVIDNFTFYLSGRKVVDVAATNSSYAFLLEDGEILVAGDINYDVAKVPSLPEGEKFVAVSAGTRHYVAETDRGHAYAWGYNQDGQADIRGEASAAVFTGAKQTYLVDENGKLIESYGAKGYLFGTDKQGRDTFTRLVHGGKMTMTIGAVAVIISTVIAVIVGCLAGYFGGWVDMLLMRVTEICASIPFLPFAMLLSYIIATKNVSETMRIFIIMVILGVLSWTGLARMIRAQVLAEREKEFVIAAQSMGVKEHRIAFRHILPNVISTILVSVTLDFAGCLLTESSLSYLGFGVQEPRSTWGNMLNGANNSVVIKNYWWQWVFPSIFLAIATISINIIGDTLRDVFDPKSSREK